MAVVRSPDFLRALIRETALATLIHQRRLTPSCGGQAPTAERTVGPARMIAASLTPKPGIREHYRHIASVGDAQRTTRSDKATMIVFHGAVLYPPLRTRMDRQLSGRACSPARRPR